MTELAPSDAAPARPVRGPSGAAASSRSPGDDGASSRRPPGRVARLVLRGLVAVSLALAAQPLLAPFQIGGHSVYSDLVRAEAFHAGAQAGDWLPRWLPDFYFRHGSPLFVYYAPGAYVAVEVLRFLGLSSLYAFKLVLLCAWILGVWGTYRLGRLLVPEPEGDEAAGLAAAAAFGLSPYFLVDLYVRGGVAEATAFGLMPLFLLGLAKIWLAPRREPEARRGLLAAASLAAVILVHNITGLFAAGLAFGLGLVGVGGLAARRSAGRAVLAGLGLSAWFWLPALVEKDRVWSRRELTGGAFSFEQNFVGLRDLLFGGGEFGFVVGPRESLAFGFGALLTTALAVTGLALILPAFGRRLGERRRFVGALWLATAGCLAMVTRFSAPLWEHLPLLPFVQFPWRFLLPASCCAALLVAASLSLARPRLRPWLAGVAILAALIGSSPYRQARYAFHDLEADTMLLLPASLAAQAAESPLLALPQDVLTLERIRSRGTTGTVGNEYLPVSVVQAPRGVPAVAAEALTPGTRILDAGWGYPTVWAEVEAERRGRVALAQLALPGWTAQVDGRPVATGVEPGGGRLTVVVPPGRHLVEARHGATPTHRLGLAASGMTVLLLILTGWRRKGPSPAGNPG